ncbi:hypothetical protein AB0C40_29500 [Streptomyces brevispora]|uniref:hypothetical protein n=1 Tax=Streptomyces brevispora TaxID=887462 RepID=UPI0033D2B1E6
MTRRSPRPPRSRTAAPGQERGERERRHVQRDQSARREHRGGRPGERGTHTDPGQLADLGIRVGPVEHGKEHEGDWIPSDRVTAFLTAQGVPATVGPFRANSAATFGDGDTTRELEVVYTTPTGDELRLTVQKTGGGRLQFPPKRDKHPAADELHTLADGRPLHLAHLSALYGACDAFWQHPDGYELRLLGSAGTGMGRDPVLTLAAALDTELRLAGHAEVLG